MQQMLFCRVYAVTDLVNIHVNARILHTFSGKSRQQTEQQLGFMANRWSSLDRQTNCRRGARLLSSYTENSETRDSVREWLSAMRIAELCGAYELRLGDGRRDTELTVAIFLISLLNLIPSKIPSRVGLALDVRLTTAGDVTCLVRRSESGNAGCSLPVFAKKTRDSNSTVATAQPWKIHVCFCVTIRILHHACHVRAQVLPECFQQTCSTSTHMDYHETPAEGDYLQQRPLYFEDPGFQQIFFQGTSPLQSGLFVLYGRLSGSCICSWC